MDLGRDHCTKDANAPASNPKKWLSEAWPGYFLDTPMAMGIPVLPGKSPVRITKADAGRQEGVRRAHPVRVSSVEYCQPLQLLTFYSTAQRPTRRQGPAPVGENSVVRDQFLSPHDTKPRSLRRSMVDFPPDSRPFAHGGFGEMFIGNLRRPGSTMTKLAMKRARFCTLDRASKSKAVFVSSACCCASRVSFPLTPWTAEVAKGSRDLGITEPSQRSRVSWNVGAQR